MVQMEVAATQRRQQALQALDSHVVLMAIVAQAAQNGGGGYTPAQMLKIMPRWGTWLVMFAGSTTYVRLCS
eukprot:10142-Eustigmatos_ZCMA.PRE.1